MKTAIAIICIVVLCYSCKKEETTNPNEKIEIASYSSKNGDSLQLDSTAPCALNISFISPSNGTYTVFILKENTQVDHVNYVNNTESPSAFNDVIRFWKSNTEYGTYSWYIEKTGTNLKTETRQFIICQKKK